MNATTLPRDERFDATAALLADPYRWIARTARARGTDAFATRIGLQPAICLTGVEAARLFYDAARFERRGGAPEPLRATLFGKTGVQNLDGAAHAHRKRWFLDLIGPGSGGVEALAEAFRVEWTAAAAHWARLPRVVLYPAIQPVLARAVCRWAGVPLPRTDVARRTREFVALFDGAAELGSGHVRSRLARGSAEYWLAGLVDAVREGRLRPRAGSALASIATFRDADGAGLPPRVAATELLNVLRPTVAVSVYVAWVAHALAVQPGLRAAAADGDARFVAATVDEVRRWYPFFPALAARVRHDFEWRGLRFPAGRRTLLDLYGTNRDPRAWAAPEAFRPQRFLGAEPDPHAFVPQGGGEHVHGHRCPGEWVTRALLAVAVEFLARRLRYALPRQDLAIEWTRLPALPASRVVLRGVALREASPRRAPRSHGAQRPSHSA